MNDSYWRTVGLAAAVGGTLLLVYGVMSGGFYQVNEIIYGALVLVSGTGILARPGRQ